MMERDDHIFDKTLREKLVNYSEPVPDDVWDNINKRRKLINNFSSRFKLIGGVSVLLLVAITVTISMALKFRNITDTKSKSDHVAATTQVEQHKSSNDIIEVKSSAFSESVASKNKIPQNRSLNSNQKNVHPAKENISSNSTDQIIIKSAVKGNSNQKQNQTSEKNNNLPNDLVEPIPATDVISVENQSYVDFAVNDTKNRSVQPLFIPTTSMRETAYVIPSEYQTSDTEPDISKQNQQFSNSQVTVADSNSVMPDAKATIPSETNKFHFRCLDIMISPGLVFKSTEASDPSSEAYAGMLDQLTKTTYTFGLEIRYRYYLNDFWNLATGLKYYQVKEEMTGQISPEQVSVKQTTGMIITPFNPPRQVTFTDTITTPAKTISQYNTFSYLRIPVLIGSNFIIFKTPVNFYGGFGYCFSIKQNGSYIDPVTHNTSDFQNIIDNPYKNAQAVNVQVGVNANRKLSKRTDLLFGLDYSRYVIPITDNAIQYQQYYQILNLNLGITYLLY